MRNKHYALRKQKNKTTRQQIERDYRIENGIICSPGMFEGEMLYVPYFWESFLNGGSDRDDGRVLGFDITAQDRKMFPELGRRRTVKLYQREDGFVCEC